MNLFLRRLNSSQLPAPVVWAAGTILLVPMIVLLAVVGLVTITGGLVAQGARGAIPATGLAPRSGRRTVPAWPAPSAAELSQIAQQSIA